MSSVKRRILRKTEGVGTLRASPLRLRAGLGLPAPAPALPPAGAPVLAAGPLVPAEGAAALLPARGPVRQVLVAAATAATGAI
jgi:hypothetical protein